MSHAEEGQILQRRGKRGITYAARFRAYGKRHYLSLGYSWEGFNPRDAEMELANILADVRRGLWKPPSQVASHPAVEDPTFHGFASDWFSAREHQVAPRTAEDYRWALSHHLLPYFHRHRLSEITVAEVDRYKAAKVRERERRLVAHPLANRSINATLILLAQVLEDAVEYGHMASNPARGRRRRLQAQPARRTWLEPEQIPVLLDGIVRGLRGGKTMPDDRMRTLFAAGICSGLRVGELLALRWRDADLAGGRLRVVESKTEAGRDRDVDLWPELREELVAYKTTTRHPGPEDFVFGTSSGRPDTRSNVAKRLRRAVERANAKLADEQLTLIAEGLTPHSLRRTYASLLYLRGETPVYVMQQMGHTDPKLALRIYAKVIGEGRRQGAGARLVRVLHGPQWAQLGTNVGSDRVEDLLGDLAESGSRVNPLAALRHVPRSQEWSA